MASSVRLSGFDRYIDRINRLPDLLKQEVDVAVEDAALGWEQRAKQDAPVDQGRLRSGISAVKKAPMEWEVVSAADYSAYMEWGTKSRVKVPAELSSYAAEFRAGKGGGNAKKMIYEWMNRVGVPKNIQYVVFLSIITKGIRPHPFFFHQAPLINKQLIQDIKQILAKI